MINNKDILGMIDIIRSNNWPQWFLCWCLFFIGCMSLISLGYADIDIDITIDGEDGNDEEVLSPTLMVSGTPEKDFSGTVNRVDSDTAHYEDSNRLEDFADTIPGVLIGRNSAGAGSDLRIRGFELNGNVYADGLLDHTSEFIRDPATIESIEIIKGHDTAVFGAGTPGGTVQIVPKKPLYQSAKNLKFALGDPQRTRLEYDATGPIDQDKRFLYRFILLRQDGKTGLSNVDDNRFTVLPMLRWLGEKTEAQLSVEYTKQDRHFDYGTVLHNGTPVFGVSYVDPRAFAKRDNTIINASLKHQLNEQWHFKLQGNNVKASQDEINIGFFSRFSEELSNDNAILNEFLVGSYLETDDTYKRYDVKAELQGKLHHGQNDNIKHQLAVGYNANNAKIEWNRNSGHANFVLSVLNPQFDYDLPTGDALTATRTLFKDTTKSLYVHDTVNMGEKWVVSAGIRRNNFSGKTNDIVDLDTDSNSTSIGLTWKPNTQLSLYGSRSQSLSPNYGRDRNNRFFEPAEGLQYDVGLRYKNSAKTFQLSTSVYDITRSNLQTVDPVDPQFNRLLGEVNVKGVEIEMAKKLMENLHFRVGYSYMRGKLTKGDAEVQGNTLNNMPKHSVSTNFAYTLSQSGKRKTVLNLGVVYVSDRQGDLENTFIVDSFRRADISLRHDFSKNATLNFSIKNLLDKDYVAASYGPETLTVGYPRRTVLSFEYLF